ncbi:MAG: S1 RNA-binding domain-containing protein, partial [Algoriella sp.]
KVQGLSMEIMETALLQAKDGRLHILGKITDTLAEPRQQLKPNAPKVVVIEIPKEFIGAIIGPGGKVIQEMQKETETVIAITEEENFGRVEINGVIQENIDRVIERIKQIAFVPEVDGVYNAVVKSIKPFGAFVEISKGVEGLVHISEIEHKRLEKVEDALNVGDKIDVKFLGYDDKKKMKLSRKALLPKPERTERPIKPAGNREEKSQDNTEA